MALLRNAPHGLPAGLRDVIEYRKSGLSLNHVIGCPLDCGYCIRHLYSNFDMKRPHLVMSDEAAIETLMGHWAFRANTTPIQIFNKATDPFLPSVKDHLYNVLEALDQRGLTNNVLVITRWQVKDKDIEQLDALSNIKLTVLVTWSGINDRRIEPVDSTVAEESLAVLNQANRTKSIFYWRPIVAGLNDTKAHFARARELSTLADATVYTGLFLRKEIRDYLRSVGVEDLYSDIARRKIFPQELERRVLRALQGRVIFRKTSCGVAFVHGLPDYNGHYGIREICDICPKGQLRVCAKAHQRPSVEEVRALAAVVGLNSDFIDIDERRVAVCGSSEQQRYFVQHALGYQVHDRALPHLPGRHGRAEIGWA